MPSIADLIQADNDQQTAQVQPETSNTAVAPTGDLTTTSGLLVVRHGTKVTIK